MSAVIWLSVGAAMGAFSSAVLWSAVCALPVDSAGHTRALVLALLFARALLCLGVAVALVLILAYAGLVAGLLALCGLWVVRWVWCLRAVRQATGAD